MADSSAIHRFGKAIKRSSLVLIQPRLACLPPAAWDEALSEARKMPFDLVERIGAVAGTALTAYLLREGGADAGRALQLHFFAQFVAAIPLLIVFVGPFYLRCARRGLDQYIAHRERPH